LPKSWDWRNEGAVTPIANQGNICGSSPYFAAVASVEGCHKMTTNELVVLSAQNLVDCPGNTQNGGCQGGYMYMGFEVIIQEKGIDTNTCYPYTGESNNKCKFNPKEPCCGSRIGSYVNITTNNTLALQIGVLQSVVASAVDASQPSFEFYTSGVYDDPLCSHMPDLGIAVIGYGYDDVSEKDYWILKIALGTNFGMEGYMWMEKASYDICGITYMPSYVIDCGFC